ncbi:HAD family hydrolase [Staphylococcus argenteus]|uniref:HAD family hydrolase n=1 Tax=Staphylococcus argenteus TaxID=985002 RepID=UPI0005020DA8|nr:HAD family hydrolase [Staphylococcus argenteus]MCG9804202.1 HAD family hydrolase [Staphylococcus argenteus]MCG9811129.1 HAD family hydrolase [Staphylococcus argenteus]MCG9824320.1 HAD family hydrolase [Staphylococcus argenteus]CDR20833.1 putative haloacid dehydrogenase-like hydrolase [Staphylococcus argenteus]
MYKNIIFDFDGTIADSKTCSLIATKKAFNDYGLNIPSDEQIEYYMGIPIEESFNLMSAIKLNEKELTELMTLFRKNYKETEAHHLKIYKGMQEQLESLHQNYKLFVVSSKRTNVLERNLSKLSVAKLFVEVIGSDKVKKYKPSPDGIIYILQKYDLQKKETIYVGDAVFDIKMAKNADIDSCAVTWGSHSIEVLKAENPNFIINNVKELNFEE